MSLISEALRKARREAAGREAARGALVVGAEPAGRSRLGLGLVLGATIALAAAVVGAGLVWWALHVRPSATLVTAAAAPAGATPTGVPAAAVSEERAEVADEEPPAMAAAPSGEQHAASGEPAPDASTEVVQPEPEEGTVPAEPGGPRVPEVPDQQPAEQSAAGGEPPVSEPGVEASAAEPSSAESGGERRFVLEADLGYAKLSLGYIVFRPEDPFAEVNGQEVHVGVIVDGFLVEKIERNEVRLVDSRGPVVLTVR